jgi:hypothetical protein
MEVNAQVHTAGMQMHMHKESRKQICACSGEMHIGLQVTEPLKLFHLSDKRNGSALFLKFSCITIREILFTYSQLFTSTGIEKV